MKQMRVSCGLVMHAYPKDDAYEFLREGLDFHKRIGFDAGDVSLNFFSNLAGDQLEDVVERGLAYSQKIGMPIELAHLPFSSRGGKNTCEDKEHFNRRMHRSIDCAKMLGVKCAVMHPDVSVLPLEEYDEKVQHDLVMKLLTPFVEHAEKIGLTVVVENMLMPKQPYPAHRYCMLPDELCKVADALGVGVCWDFGHAHIAGVKQSEGLACIGKRLQMLHVNDNHGTQDVHLAPWQGNIDWADAMQGLSAIGFEGLLNYELIVMHQPAAVRDDSARYALNAARELMKLM